MFLLNIIQFLEIEILFVNPRTSTFQMTSATELFSKINVKSAMTNYKKCFPRYYKFFIIKFIFWKNSEFIGEIVFDPES